MKKLPKKGKKDSIKVKHISLKGKIDKSLSKIAKQMGSLNFTSIESEKDKLIIRKIDREDISGTPHLYTNFIFTKEGVDIEYSITKEVNEKKRGIEICSLTLKMLVLPELTALDMTHLYKIMAESLDDAVEFVDNNYETLKNEYEELEKEHNLLKKNYSEMNYIANKTNKKLAELEENIEKSTKRIKQLEKMTDLSLMEEIISWIKTHKGEFSVLEFSKIYEVPPARVEETLDKMLKEGYLEKK